MIIPVYQPLGSSTHVLAQKVGKIYNSKATHTGTLDPMADGVILVLTGKDRFDKQIHTDAQKTYHFSILWGVQTDSLDLLGLIKKVDINHASQLEKTNIPDTIKKLQPTHLNHSAHLLNSLGSSED